jgi:hypothetical protein
MRKAKSVRLSIIELMLQWLSELDTGWRPERKATTQERKALDELTVLGDVERDSGLVRLTEFGFIHKGMSELPQTFPMAVTELRRLMAEEPKKQVEDLPEEEIVLSANRIRDRETALKQVRMLRSPASSALPKLEEPAGGSGHQPQTNYTPAFSWKDFGVMLQLDARTAKKWLQGAQHPGDVGRRKHRIDRSKLEKELSDRLTTKIAGKVK